MSGEMSRRNILKLFAVPAILPPWRWGMDIPPTTSRVYPGGDGKLIYEPDAAGDTIIDSSYVGYKRGESGIPTIPVREIIWPVPGDNTEHIQAAITRVSELPMDPQGFRGALLLRAGYYRVSSPLRIQASGVVIRGEGMGDTGTILIGVGTGNAPAPPGGAPGGGGPGGGGGGGGGGANGTMIVVGGTSGRVADENTTQTISDEYVPVGARTFRVANAGGFRPGDQVIVRRIGNQDWINALGMTGEGNNNQWNPFNIDYDRVIMEVQGNTITVDAPITCSIDQRWGGGMVMKYDDSGRIENVGVENIRAMSEYDPSVRRTQYGNMDRPNYQGEEYYSDEAHYRVFVNFTNAKNGWVREATALHFVTSMVGTANGSKWITIQDCISREPISQRAGGRRFIFALRGQLALVQRCDSDKGRHSFMTGQPNGNGNVFLDCKATSPYSSSEPHEQWSTGNLFDNVHAPLTARFWQNFVIGWAGANTVFWNCEGDFLVQKPPTAQNYSFGHIGVNGVMYNTSFQDLTRENGHLESLDRHVTPRSLYLAQLTERLGEAAVRRIARPSQLG